MNGIPDLPPAFYLIAAAALIPVLPRIGRAIISVGAPVLALALLPGLARDTELFTANLAGFELILLQVNDINYVFGIVFLLITAVAALFAWHLRDTSQQVAAMLYGAGTAGITFAGDFFTLLIFWELMAISSSWLVFARKTPEATQAGFRYLLIHFFGGSLLFAGMLIHYAEVGSLLLAPLSMDQGLAAWLILAGVGVNVAIPPLHAWVADAYPKATVTGAIFMSALTTKSAVYVLLILFNGWEILLYWGVFMALFGATYAFICNDIRQILAFHIVSQVGFMVAAVGIGTAFSVNATIAFTFSNILNKTLLFMGGSAILYAAGTSKLTELGNLARRMPGVTFLFMIGAFAICGFPFWNGFISKSMVIAAAGDAHKTIAMFGLFLASVGTFLSIGLKIPYFAFWGPDRNLNLKPIPKTMYAAMGILAFLCTLHGVAPDLLYRMLPNDRPYHPYTAYHFVESIQLLGLTFIGFWIVRHKVAPKDKLNLDVDIVYRKGAVVANALIVSPVNAFFTAGVRARGAIVEFMFSAFSNPRAWFQPWKSSRQEFDPDHERAPLAASIGFILLLVVALSLTVVIL